MAKCIIVFSFKKGTAFLCQNNIFYLHVPGTKNLNIPLLHVRAHLSSEVQNQIPPIKVSTAIPGSGLSFHTKIT